MLHYQNAKNQQNPEVQLVYKKCRCHEKPEDKIKYIKANTLLKKRYQEMTRRCDKTENFLQQVK